MKSETAGPGACFPPLGAPGPEGLGTDWGLKS